MKFRRLRTVGVAALATLIPTTGLCSTIIGVVNDDQGRPVNGAVITATDPTGNVRQAQTNLDGRYCIDAVEPGTYNVALDPNSTGVKPGNGVVKLDVEGLTVDWNAAQNKDAVATATPGVASEARLTCAAAWWDNSGVAAAAFAVTGGGVLGGLCAGDVICGGGGSGPRKPASASR